MDETTVAVTLARMEGKIDLLNATLLQTQIQTTDHENRIRKIEIIPFVTTKMLAAWALVVCGIASALPAIHLIHLGSSK